MNHSNNRPAALLLTVAVFALAACQSGNESPGVSDAVVAPPPAPSSDSGAPATRAPDAAAPRPDGPLPTMPDATAPLPAQDAAPMDAAMPPADGGTVPLDAAAPVDAGAADAEWKFDASPEQQAEWVSIAEHACGEICRCDQEGEYCALQYVGCFGFYTRTFDSCISDMVMRMGDLWNSCRWSRHCYCDWLEICEVGLASLECFDPDADIVSIPPICSIVGPVDDPGCPDYDVLQGCRD